MTVAIHEFCKDNLNLSDNNIELFKKALAGGYLGNVGPQVIHGTEFTANRWDKYITCVGSKGNLPCSKNYISSKEFSLSLRDLSIKLICLSVIF